MASQRHCGGCSGCIAVTEPPVFTMNANRTRVLIIDNDHAVRSELVNALTNMGIPAVGAPCDQAPFRLFSNRIDVVVASTQPSPIGVSALAAHVNRLRPLCQVILMAGNSRVGQLLNLLDGVAPDFVLSPIRDPEAFVDIVGQALQRSDAWGTAVPNAAENRV